MSEWVVVGAGGMLGRALLEAAERRGAEARGLTHAELDIVSGDLSPLAGASVVVNAAAFTDVDGAESARDAAFRLNADAPARLAAWCSEHGARLVTYSTDYVFAGDAASPYPTDAAIAPQGVYGQSKAEGERRVRDEGGEHLVIRTSWLFAPWGKNFARTILRLASERDTLRVVADQRGRPTYCPDLADATWTLATEGARGVAHVCNDGEATWHDFARALVSTAGLSCHVDPCTTDEFPRPAPRPAYSVLACDPVLRPWEETLPALHQALEDLPS